MSRPLLISLALVAAALAPAAPAAAVSLPAQTTALLSGTSSLFDALPAPVGDADITSRAVGGGGRYVAFSSSSDGLVTDDDDRVRNVYVKDVESGQVVLVSRADGAAGEPSHGFCGEAAISDDGKHVAFTCAGALDPDDTNQRTDVYVRDWANGRTVLASRADDLGPVANGRSNAPALDEDGSYVVFESDATNLADVPVTGRQIYRRGLSGSQTTLLVSRRAGAAGAPTGGRQPSLDDVGRRVAFTSADPADPADTNGADDVYVRDVPNAGLVLASRKDTASGAVGNGASTEPALAGDGSAVAFTSRANQFDFANDPDTSPNVYRRSLTAMVTTLVDVTLDGKRGTDSSSPSIDDTGEIVGFVTRATTLDAADKGPDRDAYVRNMTTNALELVSRPTGASSAAANADAAAVALSPAGAHAAVHLFRGGATPDADPRRQSVMLRDRVLATTAPVARPAGTDLFVNEGGTVSETAISADGRYVAMLTEAAGLGVPAGAQRGVVVRDRVTGAVELASRADGPTGAAFPGTLLDVSISADGRRVAFAGSATVGSSLQVWVRDLAEGRTYLASRADGELGTPGNETSRSPALSGDGRRVAFATNSSNLGPEDTDTQTDVHVRDLASHDTFLAGRGANGAKANDHTREPDLDADGTRVSFVSEATNLDGDTKGVEHVFVRDVGAGTTTLASGVPGGPPADGELTGSPALDDSGQRVAFLSSATNLPGSGPTGYRLYVRDLGAGTLVEAVGAPASAGTISPDGDYVAFTSSAVGLVPGLTEASPRAYRRHLPTGRIDLVSRASGPDGAPAARSAIAGDISAGGGCVTFLTDASLVGAPRDTREAYVRTLRADCAAQDPVPTTGGGGSGGGGAGGGGAPGVGGTTGGGPTPGTTRDARDGRGVARDLTAPVLSAVRLARTRVSKRRGTQLTFRLSEAATLTLTVERAAPCPRKRGRSRGGACPRWRRVAALTRASGAGAGRVAIGTRVGARRLAAGRYRLVVTARDGAQNASKPVRLAFRVVAGR